jgi:hypothetical protein
VISRFLLAVALSVMMFIGATTTFMYLGARHSGTLAPPEKPTAATPRPQALTIPGSLYLTQSGALYNLNSGRFHQLTTEAGYSMPALLPDGSGLVIVRYFGYWSDVYEMNRFGTLTRQLTSNQYRYGMSDPSKNHWSFYPRISADGGTLWMTYDGLKCEGCFDVSPAIYSMPVGGSIRQARAWTDGGNYTGGDQQPLPTSGGVMYTKFGFASTYDSTLDDKLVGMLWFVTRPNAYGRMLTGPSEDCREPALSPDQTQVAMICTYEKQESFLVLASWNGSTLGPRRVIVSDKLVAQPAWAPDGSGIAFLAPAVESGPFQLWFLPKAAYQPPPPPPPPSPTPGGPHSGPLPSASPVPAPPPVKPIQVTTNAGFDATSPMAWIG